MKRAEIGITMAAWSQQQVTYVVGFNSANEALKEFERIRTLLKRRGDKGNDLPRFLDVEGINKLTCEFDNITAVAWIDFKKADDETIGLKDTYPHLGWKL